LEKAVNPSKKFNYETREIREKEEKLHYPLRLLLITPKPTERVHH
jgi:hypothetical protein